MMERDHRSWEEADEEDAEHLRGAHSLEGWGKRLGVHKIEYQGGFEKFTPEMLAYCMQDVRVCDKLDLMLEKEAPPQAAIDDEQKFLWYTNEGCNRGFPFDVEKAKALAKDVSGQVDKLVQALSDVIPPRVEEKATPQFWRLVRGTESVEYATKGECDLHRKLQGWKPKECEIIRGPNKVEYHYFNPGSGNQVRNYFREKYGYCSPILTDKGQDLYKEKAGTYAELAKDYGSFPEDLLRNLEFPEATPIADYKLLQKRLGQIESGKSAWLKLVYPDGRIRHSLFGIGCVTHRVAHRSPNLGQVPSVELDKETKKPLLGLAGRYGVESRELFHAPEDHDLVGVDLQAIEAREFAHFLHPYDGGIYIDAVLNGDIHMLSVDAFKSKAGYGINRKDVKQCYYAYLYSAGKEKLGTVVTEFSAEALAEFKEWRDWLSGSNNRDPIKTRQMASLIAFGTEKPEDTSHEEFNSLLRWVGRIKAEDIQATTKMARKVVGGKVDMAFRKGITGLDRLITDVQKAAQRGYIFGHDKRKLPVRKEHAALNTLLQGNAAIVAKKWVNLTWDKAGQEGIDGWLAAFIHDEQESIIRDHQSSKFMEICVDAARRAGEWYKLSIPIAAEGHIGKNWSQVH